MADKPLQTYIAAQRDSARRLRSAMTEAEQRLWQPLRGYKFRRRQPFGRYIADFACIRPLLVVEADSGQHSEQAEYDAARSRYLQEQGFTVLRFWNHDILQQTESVPEQILATPLSTDMQNFPDINPFHSKNLPR